MPNVNTPPAPPGASPWYTIRTLPAARVQGAAPSAAAEDTAEILIYGDIGGITADWWSESTSALAFVNELNALKAARITVRIASLGGGVPAGLAIYNAMKRHAAHITTVVDSSALSIASLIAMGGDEVVMSENAVLMIHAPWTWGEGNAQTLRDMADTLDTWGKAMATSYASASGMTIEAATALLTDGKDHYYTAQEALAAGLCHAVIPGIPVAAMARAPSAHVKRLPQDIQARLGYAQSSAPASPATPPAAPAAPPLQPSASVMPPPLTPEAQAAFAAGVAAETKRRADIRAAFKPFEKTDGMAALMAACMDDPSITADEAGKRILAKMGKDTSPAGGHYRVETVEDERDKFRAGATAAILARANIAPLGADGRPVRAAAGGAVNPWRGFTLLELARASLRNAGINDAGMDKRAIVAAAFTTSGSDFPVLLESAMHKTLQAAYATAPDTWTRFCAKGNVSDFRAHNRYRVGSLGNLDEKNELGEFKNKALSDGEKASVQAKTKGNLINLSREAIINDDLGSFIGLSNMIGRAAKRTIEADVYAYLASNPTMGDGVALFHANHGNLAASGAFPTVTAVEAMRVAMAGQKDVGGNDFLDLRPAVALCPMSQGSTFRILNTAEYDPNADNKLNKPNAVRGLFRDVVDSARLSGNAWYAFADPLEAPTIEVAFLDGVEEPYLEMKEGWQVDGSQWKVRLDYGVAAIDHRGAYKNPGAAS